MDNIKEPTREELEQLVEKAKRDLQETLDKMTPEERAEAERKAKKAIAEDEARMQKIFEDVAKYTSGGAMPAQSKPKFCPNCGAPAGSGNFCEYCGKPLR
ncbi:MAG: hypothetical protein IJP58_02040 [Clostridia bacterium]|nr:hypothetical protein [Clostridia bacterium]